MILKPVSISGNSLSLSIIFVTIEPEPSSNLQSGLMTSKANSTVWISGTNGTLLIRNKNYKLSPFVTDATIPTINYTESAMTSVITVQQARNALKANLRKLTAERALFARYLIHMVGDIHQPLHSVALYNHTYTKGDAGGNLLKLTILNKTVQNFHSFWDAGAFRLQNDSYTFVRPMNLQNVTEMKRLASSFIDTYGKSV